MLVNHEKEFSMKMLVKNSLRLFLFVGVCLSTANIFSANNWIVKFDNQYDRGVLVKATESNAWWNENFIDNDKKGTSEAMLSPGVHAAKNYALPWSNNFIKVSVPKSDAFTGKMYAADYYLYEKSGRIYIIKHDESLKHSFNAATSSTQGREDENHPKIGKKDWEFTVVITDDGNVEVRGNEGTNYSRTFTIF